MQAKFAKALAANLRLIAQHSATVALFDAFQIRDVSANETRAKCIEEIDKAEQNIAALLMEPGAQFEPVKDSKPG